MASIEERVERLECEVRSLKAHVSAIDDDVKNIPKLVKMEARLTNRQLARLLQ